MDQKKYDEMFAKDPELESMKDPMKCARCGKKMAVYIMKCTRCGLKRVLILLLMLMVSGCDLVDLGAVEGLRDDVDRLSDAMEETNEITRMQIPPGMSNE